MNNTYWHRLWQDGRNEKYEVQILPEMPMHGPDFCYPNSSNGFCVNTVREKSVSMNTWIIPSAEPDAPLLLYFPWMDCPRPDFASLEGKYTIAIAFWYEYALAEAVREWETVSSALEDPYRFSEEILDILCVVRWIFREKISKNRLIIAGSSYGAVLALMVGAVLQKYAISVCAVQPSFTKESYNLLMCYAESLTMPVLMQSDMAEEGMDYCLFKRLPLKGFNTIGWNIPDFLSFIPENANPMQGKNADEFPELSEEARSFLMNNYCQIKLFFIDEANRLGSSIAAHYIMNQEQKSLYPRIFSCVDEFFCVDEACVEGLVRKLNSNEISTIARWEGQTCFIWCRKGTGEHFNIF